MNVTVNVGGSTAVTQAVVTGTGISGLIVTGTGASGPGRNAGTPPGIVYQYLDLTPARYTTITGAEIRFSVPQSWLDEHHVTPQGVVLYRAAGSGWQALATTFIRSEQGRNYFTATGPGFSRFVITGQAGPGTGSPGSVPLPAGPVTETPTHSPAPAILTTAAPEISVTGFPPTAAKTPSSGAGLLPVFGALGICCGVFLLRKKRT
jgi:hypothetical protein